MWRRPGVCPCLQSSIPPIVTNLHKNATPASSAARHGHPSSAMYLLPPLPGVVRSCDAAQSHETIPRPDKQSATLCSSHSDLPMISWLRSARTCSTAPHTTLAYQAVKHIALLPPLRCRARPWTRRHSFVCEQGTRCEAFHSASETKASRIHFTFSEADKVRCLLWKVPKSSVAAMDGDRS